MGEVKTRTNTFLIFKFSTFCSTIWIDFLVVFIFSCFRSTYRQFSIVFKWVMTRGFDQTMGVSFPYISLTIYQSNAQQGTNMRLVNRNRSTVSDMASFKANFFTFLKCSSSKNLCSYRQLWTETVATIFTPGFSFDACSQVEKNQGAVKRKF